MEEREAQVICRKMDRVLDLYFDELADRIERKKDVLSLRGWLRVNLYGVITSGEAGKERFGRR